jgi:hypothetical protein
MTSIRDKLQHLKKKCNLIKGNNQTITVCVRVRPMSKKEKTKHAESILDMHKDAILFNDGNKEHQYTYDHCFGQSSTQQQIYNTAVINIANDALAGYNQCVFAYGMTASGKTHTMFGDQGSERGIIPRLCEDLFQSIEDSRRKVEVEISYVEIYCEQLRDLLTSKKTNLSVHIHPDIGVYIRGVQKSTVQSIEEIINFIEEGNKRRAVGATNMNAHSSRSHAVFTIYTKQHLPTHIKRSKIHLVDLAGSEPVKKSLVKGMAFKETININKSLSTLGLVINKLSEQSKNPSVAHIPFRDSVLTTLLKEALGGNSKTVMIATVSPANIHSVETLNTLRYASAAKNIANTAHINSIRKEEDRKIIKALKEEIKDLNAIHHTTTIQNNNEIDSLRNELTLTENRFNGIIEDNKKTIFSLNKEIVSLKKDYDEAEKIHCSLNEEIMQLKEEKKIHDKASEQLTCMLNELKTANESLQKGNNSLQSKYDEAINNNDIEREQALDLLRAKHKSEIDDIFSLHKERENILQERLAEKEQVLEKLIDETKKIQKDYESALKEREDECDKLTDELDRTANELNSLQEKLECFSQIVDERNSLREKIEEMTKTSVKQTTTMMRTRRKSVHLEDAIAKLACEYATKAEKSLSMPTPKSPSESSPSFASVHIEEEEDFDATKHNNLIDADELDEAIDCTETTSSNHPFIQQLENALKKVTKERDNALEEVRNLKKELSASRLTVQRVSDELKDQQEMVAHEKENAKKLALLAHKQQQQLMVAPKEIIKEVQVVKEVPVTVEKEVVKEVIKEVPVEKEIVKEVIKEVPVGKEIVKEVKIVDKEKENELKEMLKCERKKYAELMRNIKDKPPVIKFDIPEHGPYNVSVHKGQVILLKATTITNEQMKLDCLIKDIDGTLLDKITVHSLDLMCSGGKSHIPFLKDAIEIRLTINPDENGFMVKANNSRMAVHSEVILPNKIVIDGNFKLVA